MNEEVLLDAADTWASIIELCDEILERLRSAKDSIVADEISESLAESEFWQQLRIAAGLAMSVDEPESFTAVEAGYRAGYLQGFADAANRIYFGNRARASETKRAKAKAGEASAIISKEDFATYVYKFMKDRQQELGGNVSAAATRTAEALLKGEVIPGRSVEISPDSLRRRFRKRA